MLPRQIQHNYKIPTYQGFKKICFTILYLKGLLNNSGNIQSPALHFIRKFRNIHKNSFQISYFFRRQILSHVIFDKSRFFDVAKTRKFHSLQIVHNDFEIIQFVPNVCWLISELGDRCQKN